MNRTRGNIQAAVAIVTGMDNSIRRQYMHEYLQMSRLLCFKTENVKGEYIKGTGVGNVFVFHSAELVNPELNLLWFSRPESAAWLQCWGTVLSNEEAGVSNCNFQMKIR